jgi:hypothetical protein
VIRLNRYLPEALEGLLPRLLAQHIKDIKPFYDNLSRDVHELFLFVVQRCAGVFPPPERRHQMKHGTRTALRFWTLLGLVFLAAQARAKNIAPRVSSASSVSLAAAGGEPGIQSKRVPNIRKWVFSFVFRGFCTVSVPSWDASTKHCCS